MLPTAALLAIAALDAASLAEVVTEKGCPQRLMGSRQFTFVEAQLACDAFTSFALVEEIRAGQAPADAPVRLRRLLDDALGRAAEPFASTGHTIVGGRRLPRSVLYRGWLLLMLAGMEKAGAADPRTTALFDALARAVADQLDAAPWLPSLATRIWPCDHAPAASGLILHGRLRDDDRTLRSGQATVTRLEALLELPRGFPARIDATGRALEPEQRGTVLAWTAAYLKMSGHPSHQRFASLLIGGFCERPALAGGKLAVCREWPRGIDRGPDAVSGPIYAGYGAGATALAIAATAADGELAAWHRALLETAAVGGMPAMQKRPEEHPLENAIFLWGSRLQPW